MQKAATRHRAQPATNIMSASRPPLGAPVELQIGDKWERAVVHEHDEDGYVARMERMDALIYSNTFDALSIEARLPHPDVGARAHIRLAEAQPWITCRVAEQLNPAPEVLLQAEGDKRLRFDSRIFGALGIRLEFLLGEEEKEEGVTNTTDKSAVGRRIAHWESGCAAKGEDDRDVAVSRSVSGVMPRSVSGVTPRSASGAMPRSASGAMPLSASGAMSSAMPHSASGGVARSASATVGTESIAEVRARFEANSSGGVESDDSFVTSTPIDGSDKDEGDPLESSTSIEKVQTDAVTPAVSHSEQKSSAETTPDAGHAGKARTRKEEPLTPLTPSSVDPAESPRSVTPVKPFLVDRKPVDRKATDDLSVGTKKRFSGMQKRPSHSAFAQRLRSLGLTYPSPRVPVSENEEIEEKQKTIDITDRQLSLPTDYKRSPSALLKEANASSGDLPAPKLTAFIQGEDDATKQPDDQLTTIIQRTTTSISSIPSTAPESELAHALSQANRRLRKATRNKRSAPCVISVKIRIEGGKCAPFKQWMLNLSCAVADSFELRLLRIGYQSMPSTIGFEGRDADARVAAAVFIAIFDRVHRMARAYGAAGGSTPRMTRSAYALAIANRLAERVRRDMRRRDKNDKALRFSRTHEASGADSAAEEVAASGMTTPVADL